MFYDISDDISLKMPPLFNRQSSTRKLLLLFIVFISFVYLFTLNNEPPLEEDTPVYILLARSLLDGTGYRDICYVDHPPHTTYPFVFPLLLAPVVFFSGYNFLLMRFIGSVFAILSVFMTFLLIRNRSDDLKALLTAVLTGISVKLLLFSNLIVSEMPYLFFSLSALLWIEKYKTKSDAVNRAGIVSALLLVISYFTRSIGITLMAGCMAYLFFEKGSEKSDSKKIFFIAAVFSLSVVVWSLRSYYVSGSVSKYCAEFLSVNDWFELDRRPDSIFGFASRVIANIYAYAFYAVPKVLTGMEIACRSYFASILSIIVAVGFVFSFLKRRCVMEYYLLFYASVLLLWAASSVIGVRYLLAVLPFVFYYFIVGLEFLLKKAHSGMYVKILVTVLALLFLSNAYQIVTMKGLKRKNASGFIEMTQWIRENVPPGSVFGSMTISHWLYLYSGYKSGPPIPMTRDAGMIMDSIEKHHYDYLVVAANLGREEQYLKPVTDKYPKRFPVIYSKNGNIIYRVLQ